MTNCLRYFLLAASAAILFLTPSCEDDFNLYADYDDLSVVYGLLDPNVELHQIKVTRLFQGEDDANVLAQDRELSEYGPEDITVEILEIKPNLIDTSRRWTLDRETITDKDTGVFYGPNQTIYEFSATLKPDHTYMFQATKTDGEKVTAITPLIDRGNAPIFNPQQIQLWSNLSGMPLMGLEEVNEKIDILLLSAINAKVYDLEIEFSWRDELVDGSLSEIQSISFPVGLTRLNNVPEDETDKEEFAIRMIPTDFYSEIGRLVPEVADSPGVIRRIPEEKPVKFRLRLGGEALDTYMLVNEPSNTINEDKPAYTNIENGIGVFSTRMLETTTVFLSKKSMDELTQGLTLGLTGGKGFCNPGAAPPDETACP